MFSGSYSYLHLYLHLHTVLLSRAFFLGLYGRASE